MPKYSSQKISHLKELIDFDKRFFFFLLVLIFLIIRYLTNALILDAIPGSENLEKSGEFLIFHIFNALNYLWTPLALLWKFTVIAFLFWLGSFMLGYKVSFKELWQFALVAEMIFVFPELLRLFIFWAPNTAPSFGEINAYRPLSILSLINDQNLSPRYQYAWASFNIFEILYVIIWVYGFQMIGKRSLKESFYVVLLSYFLPFLIWIGFYITAYRN